MMINHKLRGLMCLFRYWNTPFWWYDAWVWRLFFLSVKSQLTRWFQFEYYKWSTPQDHVFLFILTYNSSYLISRKMKKSVGQPSDRCFFIGMSRFHL